MKRCRIRIVNFSANSKAAVYSVGFSAVRKPPLFRTESWVDFSQPSKHGSAPLAEEDRPDSIGRRVAGDGRTIVERHAQVADDSTHRFLDATPHFGRYLGSEVESLSLDSINPESPGKAIQNVRQFDGFRNAKAMSRSIGAERSQRLAAVPCLHRAERRPSHDRVDHDHIVGILPSLDEIQSIANACFRFYAKLSQPLGDEDSGPVVTSFPIPAANDEHASGLDVLTLQYDLQKVGGAGNAGVIAAHRLLAFPSRFFDGPGDQMRRILAEIILDPLLVLRGWGHDLGDRK